MAGESARLTLPRVPSLGRDGDPSSWSIDDEQFQCWVPLLKACHQYAPEAATGAGSPFKGGPIFSPQLVPKLLDYADSGTVNGELAFGGIPILNASSSSLDTAARLLEARFPFVVRGLASLDELVSSWTPQRIAREFGGRTAYANVYKRSMVGCSAYERENGDCAGDPTAKIRLLDLINAARTRTRHVPVVSEAPNTAISRSLYMSLRLKKIDLDSSASELRAVYETAPLSWLSRRSLDSLYLRFGLEELNYRAHFDYLDNFILQIAGEKIFYMLHPRQAEHLYPLEGEPRRSGIDFRRPKPDKNPRFRQARGYWHRLLPGDALFLPMHWWHSVEAKDPKASEDGYWLTATRHSGTIDEDRVLTFCGPSPTS